MPFHVDSEVGRLHQVIVHKPGLELTRLTPQNVDDLLFDDVMWAQRAREEHDAFVMKLEAKGVPTFGIVSSTVLASVFMIMSYAGAVGITVFNTLVFMSGITAAIPYGFSALAQLSWRIRERRTIQTARLVRDAGVAAVALVFSVLFIVYSRNTGEDTVWKQYLPFIFAGIAFLAGIPIYLKHRTSMQHPPAVPAWRP